MLPVGAVPVGPMYVITVNSFSSGPMNRNLLMGGILKIHLLLVKTAGMYWPLLQEKRQSPFLSVNRRRNPGSEPKESTLTSNLIS